MTRTLPVLLASLLLVGASPVTALAQDLPWDALAARIVSSLDVHKGERVLLRYDPQNYGALEPVVRKQLEAAGAVVESLTYAPAADLAARLARTDVYIWLPAGESADTGAGRTRAARHMAGRGQGPADPFPLERRDA